MPAGAPSRAEPRQLLAGILLVVAVSLVAFAPAHDVFLAGDDFEWLEASYGILARPLSSFEPINHFFRPLVKWTFVVDYLLFRQFAPGYMATNLAIHLLNVALLCLLMFRRIRPVIVIPCAMAFALSPLHSEAVLWASGRPDTLLLTLWLGAILLLDRQRDESSPATVVGFLVIGLVSAGAKETWVLFPLLATAFSVLVKGDGIGVTLRRMSLLWVGLAIYLFFMLRPMLSGGPSAAHYAQFGLLPAVTKIGRTVCLFLGIGGLGLTGFPSMLVALSAFMVVMVVALRSANRFAVWSILWTLVTLAIAAPFEHSALRHNYLPLVGFWMVAAALLDQVFDSQWLDRARRRAVQVAAAGVVLLVLTVEGMALQLEIDDYRRYGEVHRQLYESYLAASSSVPTDRPLILINRGSRRAVEEVAREVRGVQKTFFVRAEALWQLVFLAPLAEFAGDPFHLFLETVPDEEVSELAAGPLTLLLFTDQGFVVRSDLVPQLVEGIRSHRVLPPGGWAYRFQSR